jgi:hypothetical protein
MTGRIVFGLLVVSLCAIMPPMAESMRQKPVEIKLGYLPNPQALKVMVADHAPLAAEYATVKVLFYFGTIVQKFTENVIIRPEFANMYRTLQTAVQLDPYNEDAYYFTQAAFTWELGRIKEVNQMLEYGMRFRTWDYWLPFYAGFNYAYFLKEYDRAATYMQRAAEISGNPLFTKLTARYFYESNQTAMGLSFLDTAIANTKDPALKKTYEYRRDALLAVARFEQAMQRFAREQGRPVKNLHELVTSGILDKMPEDPYGGEFYLDADGRIRSSSQFANPNM